MQVIVTPDQADWTYETGDRAEFGITVLKNNVPLDDIEVIYRIHGIPVNLDEEVYDNLRYGALDNYWVTNLDDRDKYYFKRVYLGCVRAVDFIESLDCFNGEDIAVTGGSQGGALSIVTAGLDDRIDYFAAFYPALADLTGYLHDRAGGWPHMFRDGFTNKHEKVETSKYFDVVNFARFVEVPGWYSWGFNDNVCPPTSTYSAYNVIDAKKRTSYFSGNSTLDVSRTAGTKK